MTEPPDVFDYVTVTGIIPTECRGRLTELKVKFDASCGTHVADLRNINTQGGRYSAENLKSLLPGKWAQLHAVPHNDDSRHGWSLRIVPSDRDADKSRIEFGCNTCIIDSCPCANNEDHFHE